MNINRPLMPGFLKRAEQKLLLNKPLIWSTRVHLVLYYGILYNFLLAGLCFLAPINMQERSKAEYWVGFQIIIAIIALTIWLIFLLRFNVFKKYGNIKPLHALVSFLLYFISTGIIVLSAFIYPVVECVRANIAFGDKELVQDINNINIKLCQLEHKVLNKKWNYDTVYVGRNADMYAHQHEAIYKDTTPDGRPVWSHALRVMNTAMFNNKLAVTDSVVKLNDSMYLLYNTPEFQFVSGYMLEESDEEKIFSSFELYNKALKHPPGAAEEQTITKELNNLERKYLRSNEPDIVSNLGDVLPERVPFDYVQRQHPVSQIGNSISNIILKKYSFSQRYLSKYLRVFYYFTLGITLLIFIFRYTTVRTFFLSVLSGVLLAILTVMMLSFLSYNGDASFIGWLIGYTLVFFIGSVFTFSSIKRSMLNGIFINLFVFMVPVLPLLVVEFFYEMDKDVHYKEYGTYDWPFMDQCFLYAEIGGAILLLVLLATYINKLYRRWYSLPEN